MSLNTWAAFYGNNQDAVVAGDVAMLAAEVTPTAAKGTVDQLGKSRPSSRR
jgi:hypothetical protein